MHHNFPEWRTALELSRDPVGIAEIVEGQDTHSLNQVAFNLPSRLIAKIYLFRTIFRGSGYAFSVDPAFSHVSNSPQFWDGINEQFYRKYMGLDQWHQRSADGVARGESLVGPFGRQWTIDMGRSYKGELKIPWTTLTNYPVQGTGADVIMIARISFFRRLKSSGIPALIISTIHDSIVVDVEEKWIGPIVEMMYQVFDDLIANIYRCFKYEWVVPLAAEVKMGPNFKDQTKVERNS